MIQAVASQRQRSGRGLAPALGTTAIALASGLFLLFFMLPLVALVWRSVAGGSALSGLGEPVVVHALVLTIATTAVTVLISLALGTPLAFALARRRFPGREVVDVLVTLPIVLPPLVSGVALLVAFGRRGLLGEQLALFGIEIPFTTAAVVLAQLFVAGPFYVRSARVGFATVSREMVEAAAVAGAGGWQGFRRVILPLALPGVFAGLVLCAARAFSEFGATLMFAGNLEGRTQTMALAIETVIQTDLNAALALSLVLVGMAAIALAVPLLLLRRAEVL